MKCPTCGENTPDAWQQLIAELKVPDAPVSEAMIQLTLISTAVFELEAPGQPHPHRIHFDRMYCAAEGCHQLVIRGHDSYTLYDAQGAPSARTDTWLIHPRLRVRPVDPLVPEGMARDFGEAAAILDVSHRMSAVLGRRILSDLLETYAGLGQFSLAARIDKFVADTNRPFGLRQNLHYLREIADFSAHTQTDGELEILDIDREEAEWTLDVVEELFDYFIVTPEKERKLREGMDAKLEKAGRKKIEPLKPDPPQVS